MTMLLAAASVVFMVIGVLFLLAAALGVLRFPDALQRMHASTKAGTVGAIFVIMGAIAAEPRSDFLVIGAVAVGFLLLTVPVAAHLLGRATYVSGALLTGLAGKDALQGLLARRSAPLEERTAGAEDAGTSDGAAKPKPPAG